MAEEPRDDVFDVQLNIVGQESLGRLQALADQLSKIQSYFAAVTEQNPAARAAAQAGLSQATRNAPVQSGSSGTHSEPPSPITAGGGLWGRTAGRLAAHMQNTEEEQSRELMGHGGGVPYRSSSLHRPQEVETEMLGGGVSGSGSLPPDAEQPQSIGERKLRSELVAYHKGQQPFVYPQFGSLTWQDRAVLASNLVQKATDWRIRKNQSRINDQLAAGGITQEQANEQLSQIDPSFLGAGSAADVTTLLRGGAAGLGIAQGVYTDFRDKVRGFQQAGIQAGYEKAGTINIGPFGITNPLDLLGHDSAGKESLRQWWTTQRLRMKGGINQEEAQQIVGSLSALGWTGSEGQNMAFDTISPLVQKGLNPEMTTLMMDKSLRQGNASLDSFKKTLDDIGTSAHNSRMSLDEYQKALDAAGETAKQNGGFYLQGVQSAKDFSGATGLTPQAMSQTWQSPLVQGMAMSQFGIMPNAMGSMSGHMGLQTTYSALDLAKRATSMFARQDTVDPRTGEVISGKQAQYAQMAPLLGMSVEEVRRLDTNREMYNKASVGLGRISQFTKDTSNFKSQDDWVKDQLEKQPWKMGNKHAEEALKRQYREQVDNLNAGRPDSWGGIRQAMTGVATTSGGKLTDKEKKRIDEISHISDINERNKQAREFIIKQRGNPPTNKDMNTVHVEFTGKAAQLFKEVGTKDPGKSKANSGGGPINDITSGALHAGEAIGKSLLKEVPVVGGLL